MKNFKSIVSLTFLFFTGVILHAQQQGQYSQYMMNYFLVNPAAAGTEDFADVKLGYRQQWTGVEGSPQNYYVSAHTPLNKMHSHMRKLRRKADPHHTIGGMFSGQKLGLLSHNSGYLSYAYNMPLTKSIHASMGIVAGFNQVTLDNSNLNWGDNIPDPTETNANNNQSNIKPDLGLGLWLYSSTFFVGVSSMQIIQNKLEFSSVSGGDGMLNRHYYITGGVKIKASDAIKVIPSVFLKHTATAYQMDLNTKVRFKDLVWGGVSYRSSDAVVFLAGAGIPLTKSRRGSGHRGSGHGNDIRLEIGYSYDVMTSGLAKYAKGSHEFMVGLILPTGGRVISPENYW